MPEIGILGVLNNVWNFVIAPFYEVLAPFINLGSGISTLVGLLP